MSNIKKTFESFVNEELDQKTLLSAAKKLSDLGHKKRSDKIMREVLPDDVSREFTVTYKGVEHTIDAASINMSSSNTGTKFLIVRNIDGKKLFSFTPTESSFTIPDARNIGDKFKDRKSARNFLKLLKIWDSINPEPELGIDKLTVNGLYED